jgi:hypothetical protein
MKIDIDTPIEHLNKINKGTLMEQLHIEYLEVGDGFVKARMPVNERTKQSMGILHGGANLALAETIGGLGSALIVDLEEYDVRGSQLVQIMWEQLIAAGCLQKRRSFIGEKIRMSGISIYGMRING